MLMELLCYSVTDSLIPKSTGFLGGGFIIIIVADWNNICGYPKNMGLEIYVPFNILLNTPVLIPW